jgi:hypothetical protein
MRQTVGARLTLEVIEPADVMLQIAVAHPTHDAESLEITAAGDALEIVEVDIPGSGRVHRFQAEKGRVEVSYSAEFAGIAQPDQLLPAISSWVGTQLSYVPGSSRPTDGAVETLLQRRGVCRDYAHLVIALLRSLDIPARLTSVYAPGLDPMDFHAVAEAALGGRWYVVDATLLAPRKSLVRISTGRDAADTAFLSSYRGNVELVDLEVLAIVNGVLPNDNVQDLVTLD